MQGNQRDPVYGTQGLIAFFKALAVRADIAPRARATAALYARGVSLSPRERGRFARDGITLARGNP